MQRKKILWLVSWYPNALEAFDGDFIQRHARAAALVHDIYVLFVKEVGDSVVPANEVNQQGGLTEVIFYIKKRRGKANQLINALRWQRTYRRAIKHYVAQRGKPHLVHVHVPWKAGLIALMLLKSRGWKYVVTEHWGIYNRQVEDNITRRPFLVQQLLKAVIKNAQTLVSVSGSVGRGINKYLVTKKFIILPNVVDTSLFSPTGDKHPTFTFIHVSNMVPLKGVAGILEAFKLLVDSGCTACRLVLIGNKDQQYPEMAARLGLSGSVQFLGEVPYTDVAAQMQRAHCLLLNSTIENAPCVISEALCCGLPVIATKVGGIPEMISKDNGLLVKPGSTKSYTAALKWMIENYTKYDSAAIAANASATYSYATVAARFDALYEGKTT